MKTLGNGENTSYKCVLEKWIQKNQAIKAFHNANEGTNHKSKILDNFVGEMNLPYVLGTTEKIAQILKRNNFRNTFKLLNTICIHLNSVKDPIDPKCQKGVYLILVLMEFHTLGKLVDIYPY